jgi:hypothetical protein
MAGPAVPAIQVFFRRSALLSWMPETSPGMAGVGWRQEVISRAVRSGQRTNASVAGNAPLIAMEDG